MTQIDQAFRHHLINGLTCIRASEMNLKEGKLSPSEQKAEAEHIDFQLKRIMGALNVLEANSEAVENINSLNSGDVFPIRKVCFFTLKNGKYLASNGMEITTEMLVKYSHSITDTWSYIVFE